MEFLEESKRKKLHNFCKFVCAELEIKNPPLIKIQNNRNGLKTTANYDYSSDEKVMKICAKGRALVDVMRSIAHELTHHKQWEDGRLEVKPADIGSDIENEANAKAGIFIKKYALKDNTIYDE
jgi:hypothetical protein